MLDLLEARAGERVLEIGCGTGASLVRLASRGAADVVGLDLLPEMLAAASMRLRLAGLPRRLVRANAAGGLPIRTGAVSRVYAESVLGFQQPDEARAMLAEWWRVLASGGRVVACDGVWRAGIPVERAAALHAAHEADFGIAFASPQPWSADDWCNEMRLAGFTVRLERFDQAVRPHHPARRGRAEIASHAFTTAGRWSQVVRPSHLAAAWRFRRSMRAYATGDVPIEGALFVLDKP